MEFDSVITVKKEITKEAFLRQVLILITKTDAPLGTVNSQFGEVRESVKEVMVCSAHVESDYTVSVGYNRREQYQTTESKYLQEGSWYTCGGVSRRADKSGSYKVDCIKERTVTDWQPHSGHASGNATCAISNGNANKTNIEVSRIINTVKKSSCVEEGEAEVASDSLKSARRSCRDIVESRIKFPGDCNKDFESMADISVEKLTCYKLPYYQVDYVFEGNKYTAEGFACGELTVTGTVPKDKTDVAAVVEEKTKVLKIAKFAAWILFAVSYVVSWVMFALGNYWTWVAPVVLLAAAIVIHIVYNKKYNDIYVDLYAHSDKLKLDELKAKLAKVGYAPLTAGEEKCFNATARDYSFDDHLKGGMIGWAIFGGIITVVVIITSLIGANNANQTWLHSAEQVTISVTDKTEEYKSNVSGYTNGCYYIYLDYEISANKTGVEYIKLKTYVSLDGESIGTINSSFSSMGLSAGETDTYTTYLEATQPEKNNKTFFLSLYDADYEDLSFSYEILSIQFSDGKYFSGSAMISGNTASADSDSTEDEGNTALGDSSSAENEGNTASADSDLTEDYGNAASADSDSTEDKGNTVSSDSGSTEDVGSGSGDQSSENTSEELIYTLSDDNTYYILSGVSSEAADMTEVNIPEYYNGIPVTQIAESAFSGNTVITSVIISDKVTAIGEKAFYGCTALKSVTIGADVKTIGNYSFYNCTSLTQINYNATSASDLSASNYAFYCAGKSGDGIILTVGASVKSIPAYIFYPFSSGIYSPKITRLQFADNSICTSIKTYAFYGCSALLEITIPSKVTSIATYAFGSCTALTKIYYSGIASSLTSNAFAFAGQSGEGITVTISASVTQIPISMFYTSGENYAPKIISVVFEENSKCTSIGGSAFVYCTSLQSINIPDTVKSLGSRAFYDCSSLTSINIPDGVTTIGGWTFYYCTSLLIVNIPDSVTTIEYYAFEDCNSLVSIVIPDSVITIGQYAFYHCYSLIDVTIGRGVMAIDSSAFYGCYKLVEVYNLSSLKITAGSSDNGDVGYYAKNVYTFSSGSSKLVSKGDYIFYNGNGIYYLVAYTGIDTSVVLPDGVYGYNYSIDDYAFYKNTNIKSVTMGGSVMAIGNHAFYECSSLTSVTIGSGVTAIGNYAFYECSSLTSVTIGSGVTSIGTEAFANCTALESVTMGSSVTSIGNHAFYGCSSLTSITIGSGVTSIGMYAFYGCSSLTSITIGSGVTSIGMYAFEYCTSLTSVYYMGTMSEWKAITFGYNSANPTYYGATIYYYAENGSTMDAGNYWYYDNTGNIKTWSVE